MRRLFFLLLMALMLNGLAGKDISCHGRFMNPITDINWDMVFPIRIIGVPFDFSHSSTDSPLTVTSPICVCPSHVLGIPVPGIMVTFHEPLYVEEIVRDPGCLSSIGSVKVLHGYDMERSELKEDLNSGSRWQIHWYEYPVFSVLDLFKDFVCTNTSGFSLAYMTEFDPTWQNDEWGAVFAPEAALFANPIAQSACALDAGAASLFHPIDALFWCAGSWGSVYPLTGNTNAAVGRIQSANLAGAKMIARLSRMGLLWDTVGPQAVCSSVPMPIWIKSEFSIDPVYPVVSTHHGLAIGEAPAVSEYTPVESLPAYENINQVIFQEQQCCIRP
jgi:conjugal transfer pilus assembly protein TraU